MLGKLKQAGNDVKKSMGDMKAHAEMEAEYLKSKSKGFEHPPDINHRVKLAAEIYTAYEELLACAADWVDKYQEVINNEVKTAERFKEKVSQNSQNTVISKYSARYSEYNAEIHQLRQSQLGFVLEYIQLPVKKYITEQTNSYKPKLESLNRSVVELKYWKSKPSQIKQQQESQILYESISKTFAETVDSLRDFAEKDFPQKLAAFQQAQTEFFSGAVKVATFLDSPDMGFLTNSTISVNPPPSTIEDDLELGNGNEKRNTEVWSSTETYDKVDF